MRMEREKHCGTVTKTGEDEYLFTAEVFDPMEIFPWICSFTGRILRLECDDPAVTAKYAEYLSQMAEAYGLDEDSTDQPFQTALWMRSHRLPRSRARLSFRP